MFVHAMSCLGTNQIGEVSPLKFSIENKVHIRSWSFNFQHPCFFLSLTLYSCNDLSFFPIENQSPAPLPIMSNPALLKLRQRLVKSNAKRSESPSHRAYASSMGGLTGRQWILYGTQSPSFASIDRIDRPVKSVDRISQSIEMGRGPSTTPPHQRHLN